MDRRTFVAGAIAAATASGSNAQAAPDWGGPVLDIHLHPRREPDGELKHMAGSGVTKAVVLAAAGAQSQMREKMQKHPGRLFLFASTNVAQPDSIDVLKNSLKAGAIGIGELKSRVAADSPEMRRVYELAAERGVPVLIHFFISRTILNSTETEPTTQESPVSLKSSKHIRKRFLSAMEIRSGPISAPMFPKVSRIRRAA
jgi:hypothetical protein